MPRILSLEYLRLIILNKMGLIRMNVVEFFDILISLIIISNPIILTNTILSIPLNKNPRLKKQTAILSSVVGGAVLITMTWTGTKLLTLLGLRMEAFQIAGGIVVIVLGFAMLNAKISSMKTSSEEEISLVSKSMAITPLAFPLIAGPGSISAVIFNANRFPGVLNLLLLSLACTILALISWFFMRFSCFVEKKIGNTGLHIFERVTGLILLTLGIQILMSGIGRYFPELTPSP